MKHILLFIAIIFLTSAVVYRDLQTNATLSGEGSVDSPLIVGTTNYIATKSNLNGTSGSYLTGYAVLAGKSSGQRLIGGTGTTDDLVLQATSGVGASGSDIIFNVGNNGATEAMRILYDGKIGIGITNPTTKFWLQDAATTTQPMFENTNASGRLNLVVRQSAGAGGAQYDLRAYGSSYSETLFGNSMSDANALIAQNNALFIIGNYSNSDLIFGSNNLERVRVKSSGEVGIGTGSTVSAKLHTIATTEQERIGYDASNYVSTTVSSSGQVTYNAVGSGARFIFSDRINIATHTPSGSSDTGTAGDIAWDGSYLYICVATDTWTRVALAW